jgi:hypothetical protein
VKKHFLRAAVILSSAGMVLAGMVSASSALADSGSWSAPTNISTGPAGMYDPSPHVSFGPAGEAIAVWTDFDGSNVFVRSSSSTDAGVTWSPAIDLSASGENADAPQIDIDSSGNAIAVWSRNDGVNSIIQSRTSTDGGASWSAVEDLSASGMAAYKPQVSFDSSGNAIAVWYRYTGVGSVVQSRASNDGGATWDPVVNLTPNTGDGDTPQVSFDASGNAIAIWSRYDGTNSIVQSRSSSDGGANWDSVVDLSEAGKNAYSPQVTFDAAGNAIAIWSLSGGSGTVIQTRSSSDSGATWRPVVALSPSGQIGGSAQISCDATGKAIAIWSLSDGVSTYKIQTSSSTDGGATWSPAVDLSEGETIVDTPQISIDAAGTAIAVWYAYDGSRYVIDTRSSSDGGATWGTVFHLSSLESDGYGPEVSTDAAGNALVIWYLFDDTNCIIQSSTLAAPALPDTGVSPLATAGFVGVGVGMLAAGIAALVVVRRRQTAK